MVHYPLILSMRQASADDRSKYVANLVTNVKLVEFHDHIWNNYGKYIQISTNMPGIGLEMFEMLTILRNKTILCG